VLLGQRGLIRLAAFAGAEARPLGVRGGRMEPDVLGPGGARRAGRAAVHTGRLDRVEKLAVRLGIAADHGRPKRIALSLRRERFSLRGHIHLCALNDCRDQWLKFSRR
jgi:hypothetical protein